MPGRHWAATSEGVSYDASHTVSSMNQRRVRSLSLLSLICIAGQNTGVLASSKSNYSFKRTREKARVPLNAVAFGE